MAKLVAWHRYYTRFWKQSALFCDFRWPLFFNDSTPDHRGIAGEGEPRFLNAVTGKGFSFRDGIDIGRKIWNLDNAIWTLQGRHRDMVHFAEHIYQVPFRYRDYQLPGRRNGKWDYIRVNDRHLDRDKFEEFKTQYYELEGWDVSSGWPKRNTLEALGLGYVADELETKGKLGS
jgi:aldehyde:ferredoxin oxidoreductase